VVLLSRKKCVIHYTMGEALKRMDEQLLNMTPVEEAI
jgi:hypothetical protein